jgi:hypothetical protein
MRAIPVALVAAATAGAVNLANPAAALPTARALVGVSYDLGFYTITNREIPCLMNRVHARAAFSPISYFNIGVDLGASQMDVASDTSTSDTLGLFHGKMGFSGGANVKLTSPFFVKNLLAVVGIAEATYFNSTNENNAAYGGIDGAGGLGAQFHIPGFGFVTAGCQVYLIMGSCTGYDGVTAKYYNSNNVRGWLAIDYFPRFKIGGESHPYISVELTVGPGFAYNDRTAFRDFGFSIAIGTFTKRLYGEQTDVEWEP